MTGFRLLARSMAIFVLAVAAQAADKNETPDYAKLITGKWEVIRADNDTEVPVASVIEFGADGKMKATLEGKEKTVNGTYKVEGNKVLYTLKLNDKDVVKDPITIKKITVREMVLECQSGEKEKTSTVELKRLK